MGERAAGPMAKRSTSPQSGAVAPAIGRPKIPTEAFPASAVPTTHGVASTRAVPTPSAATTRTRQAESRAPDEDRAHRPGERHDDDERDDGRREARGQGDDGPEDGDLPGRPVAPSRTGLDCVGGDTGGPGQL